MMKPFVWMVVCFLLMFKTAAFTQEASFLTFELSILEQFKQIQKAETAEARKSINQSVIQAVEKWLENPETFEYTFDTLSTVGNLISDDKKIKVITWNIPNFDGTSDYFGYIQHREKNDITTTKLTFTPSAVNINEQQRVYPNNWYGALYYQIITNRYSGKSYYTLLGFIPDNMFTHKKVIDQLVIEDTGLIHLGEPIFSTQSGIKQRMVFEYSARLVMMLRYNNQMDMIVYDHLSPSNPNYKDRYQFYGPDLSYDGLTFSKGMWMEKTDIQIEY